MIRMAVQVKSPKSKDATGFDARHHTDMGAAKRETYKDKIRRYGKVGKVLLGIAVFSPVLYAGYYETYPPVHSSVQGEYRTSQYLRYTRLADDSTSTHKLEYKFKAVKDRGVEWVSYLLNGGTNKGELYQFGLNYDESRDEFQVIYSKLNQTDRTHAEKDGLLKFNKEAKEGDDMIVTLEIGSNNTVHMELHNLRTNEKIVKEAKAEGNIFILGGSIPNFTGVMTERFSYKPITLGGEEPAQKFYNLSNPIGYGAIYATQAYYRNGTSATASKNFIPMSDLSGFDPFSSHVSISGSNTKFRREQGTEIFITGNP